MPDDSLLMRWRDSKQWVALAKWFPPQSTMVALLNSGSVTFSSAVSLTYWFPPKSPQPLPRPLSFKHVWWNNRELDENQLYTTITDYLCDPRYIDTQTTNDRRWIIQPPTNNFQFIFPPVHDLYDCVTPFLLLCPFLAILAWPIVPTFPWTFLYSSSLSIHFDN